MNSGCAANFLTKSDLEASRQRLMVAASCSQVHCTVHGCLIAVGEDVVHPAEGRARVDSMHIPLQGRGGLRISVLIKVSDQNDEITLKGIASDHSQHVESGGLPATLASRVHGQRPMMVHEEQGLPILGVAQSHPLRGPVAVVLRALVFVDVSPARSQELPAGLAPGDGDGVAAVHGAVVVLQPRVSQHPIHVIALLETHHIERLRGLRTGDELPSAASVASALPEEVPPEEVVGEGLDFEILP
mmetsp:Transcript_50548/g.90935  ORF Transcript_50548/g.90935 Transcript_50548/m.90935 type:complete len:244 (+) Transcript_50548:276-1007(+)